MEWLPTARLEVEKVAVPPLRVPVPSVAVPSRKVTMPVGVPAPGAFALTEAVNVTLWPNTEGLVEEETLVVVSSWLTIWGEALLSPLLPPQPGSPGERGRDGMAAHRDRPRSVKLACPVSSTGTADARVSVPSVKLTVPVGMPAPLPPSVTTAVTVTVWPKTEGSGELLTVVVVCALDQLRAGRVVAAAGGIDRVRVIGGRDCVAAHGEGGSREGGYSTAADGSLPQDRRAFFERHDPRETFETRDGRSHSRRERHGLPERGGVGRRRERRGRRRFMHRLVQHGRAAAEVTVATIDRRR